jgi:hypothetical protein
MHHISHGVQTMIVCGYRVQRWPTTIYKPAQRLDVYSSSKVNHFLICTCDFADIDVINIRETVLGLVTTVLE